MGLAFGIMMGFTLAGALINALPPLVVELVRRDAPDVVFSVDTSRPAIALTIDDGPSEATPEILDVLREHGVKATFFVIGEQLTAWPELTERILAEGHELGHHMLRDEPSIELPADTFVTHFDRVDAKLDDLGGSALFRPGSGWFDERMVAEASLRGYRTVLGSIYPFDAHLPFPRFASWFVMQQAAPGGIIVLHDGQERGVRTAEVLRRILPGLQRRGFQVVPVSALLEGDQGASPMAPTGSPR
jgi:peptidoglycan-N-acetylglucosamine deacetylase